MSFWFANWSVRKFNTKEAKTEPNASQMDVYQNQFVRVLLMKRNVLPPVDSEKNEKICTAKYLFLKEYPFIFFNFMVGEM